MNDLYTSITERIVASLEAGVPPWLPAWRNGSDGIPRNLTSGRPYRGINVLLLNLQALAQGYSESRWLTFRQADELGAHVRKGEQGTPIVFFKWHDVSEQNRNKIGTPDQNPPAPKVIPLLRSFTVFNAAQIDGLPERYLTPPPAVLWTPCEEAEDILIHSRATVRHGGNRACYSPGEDLIQLPPSAYFPSAEGYYGTALHELTHWTGHPSRCNRPLGHRHGIDAYAFEELVAEMGAAFLCAHCRLPGRLEHASYIDSWLDALRRDKRLIFVAAGKAQAAADYVLKAADVMPSPALEAEAA